MDPTQTTQAGMTGIPWLDAVMQIVGGLGALASIGATVLPRAWAFTSLLARFGADVRKVNTHEPDASQVDK